MELWGKFWYLASRALSSRYFFLHFNVNLWPKRRRCSVPLKSLRLIAAPLAFPSISLRLWRVLFLLAKKWCFQKQAWNLKTCYVLHCRRMQRCWALWTLKQIHYHYLTSKKYKSFTCKCWRERNVQLIISWWQVLFVIIANRSCHQDVMTSVGKTPLIMISIEINLKDGDSQIGGWL